MSGRLRPGSIVRVKSESEIALTLDERTSLEGLPFMPEMLGFCGRSFEVLARPNRIQVEGQGIRRIEDCVILKVARCNGAFHGGCQRGCLLLFKTDWLRSETSAATETVETFPANPIVFTDSDAPLPPCQGLNACLLNATSQLSRRDVRQYIRDIGAGTLSSRQFLCMTLFLLNRRWDSRERIWELTPETLTSATYFKELMALLGQNIRHALNHGGMIGTSENTVRLCDETTTENLQPGDMVEVKSKEEIIATLDAKGRRHKGMSFEGSQVKYCGRRFRVLKRVTGLIVESKDAWLTPSSTVMLEDCTCDGLSFRGCPRRCYWLWREIWLRKVGHSDEVLGSM